MEECPNCGGKLVPWVRWGRPTGLLVCVDCWFKWDPKTGQRVKRKKRKSPYG